MDGNVVTETGQTGQAMIRYLPAAHWRGNVYSRKIVHGEDGKRIIVTLIEGRNVQATCSQVAARSVPRRRMEGSCVALNGWSPVG